jgi:hypothetical protein
MPNAAIIVISVLSGAGLLLIVAALSAVIVLHFRTHKVFRELTAQMVEYAQSMDTLLENNQEELGTIVESAKQSFGNLRQDIKASQESQKKALDGTLKKHEEAFRETMSKINATALEKASIRGLQAANEMTQVASLLKNLVMSHDMSTPGEDLAPEEYAPSDTIYDRQSTTSLLDERDQDREAKEMAPMFSGVGAE